MLNAVSCVWNEEDIIASSVRHALAQGCENVFIIDNGSTDNTVQRALSAGAQLAASFKSKFFDERQKIAHLNAVVQYHNSISTSDSTWWIYFDADEFPVINAEAQIGTFLHSLDRRVKGLHGHLYNHIPTHPPYFMEGYHPVDFMPLCVKSTTTKIPVLRYDKGQAHLFSAGGAHEFCSNDESTFIVTDIVDIHHFPHRAPEHTLKRLKILLDRSDTGTSRIDWMDKRSSLIHDESQSHYHKRYQNTQKIYKEHKYACLKNFGCNYAFKSIQRWHPHISLTQDIFSSKLDYFIFKAVHAFWMGDYDTALCMFNDALNSCDSDTLRHWITIKMAECFSFSDTDTAKSLVTMAGKANNPAIAQYIQDHLQPIVHGTALSADPLFQRTTPRKTLRMEKYRTQFQIDPAPLLREVDKIVKRVAARHKKAKGPGPETLSYPGP